MLNFKLHQHIKFNRPVDIDSDIISAGAYRIFMLNEEGEEEYVRLDFKCSSYGVNGNDETLVDIIQSEPYYEEFAELEHVTEHMLRNIVGVDEWFIDTGSPAEVPAGKTPLIPVLVMSASFELLPSGDYIELPTMIKPSCNFPTD